jgi:hypothetical protein
MRKRKGSNGATLSAAETQLRDRGRDDHAILEDRDDAVLIYLLVLNGKFYYLS